MHRFWFKVWQQGQAVDPPVPVASLPRGTQITATTALRRRGRALSEVYALAGDAEQARQVFEEARDRLPTE
jgi:hypothetical protein